MTLNGVMAVTLRYFTEFGKHSFQHITAGSSCGGIYAGVYCILYHVYDVVVKKVRYLISWWVSCYDYYYYGISIITSYIDDIGRWSIRIPLSPDRVTGVKLVTNKATQACVGVALDGDETSRRDAAAIAAAAAAAAAGRKVITSAFAITSRRSMCINP